MPRAAIDAGSAPAHTLFGFNAADLLRIVGLLTWCGICAYMISPRLGAIILVLSAVMPAIWYFFKHGRLPRLAMTPSLVVLLAFGAYLLLSVTWSIAPGSGLLIALRHFLFVAALALTLQLLDSSEPEFLATMLRAFVFAGALMTVVMLFEVSSQMALRRFLNNLLPVTRSWDSNVVVVENDRVVTLANFLTNRNVAALSFLFWPAVYASRLLVTSDVQKVLRWLFIGLAVEAILLSHHESSKVALLAGGIIFGLAWMSRIWAGRAIVGGWLIATLLVVPIALVAKPWTGLEGTINEISFRHRIVIWGTTAEKVLERPWFGVGAGASRVVDELDRVETGRTAPVSADRRHIPAQTGFHAHNIYLQAWFELGFFGALLLLLSGLPLLRWIWQTKDDAFPYVAAAFALCATMAAFSYSLTSPWFLGSFGLAAIFMRLAVACQVETTVAAIRQPIDVAALFKKRLKITREIERGSNCDPR